MEHKNGGGEIPPLSVPAKADAEKNAAPARVATPLPAREPSQSVPNGVAVKAPDGMKEISVGGVCFPAIGGFFTMPEALAKAAVRHLEGIERQAAWIAKRDAVALRRALMNRDIPEWFRDFMKSR